MGALGAADVRKRAKVAQQSAKQSAAAKERRGSARARARNASAGASACSLAARLLAVALAVGGASLGWQPMHVRAAALHEARLALRLTRLQRCPPATDRFHDHCVEGRTHQVLTVDWDCLGPRNAEAMRLALDIETADGSRFLRGMGEVPSWLTAANVAALATLPCIKAMRPDLACWHCKPRPKGARISAELRAEAELAEKARTALAEKAARAAGAAGAREAAAESAAEGAAPAQAEADETLAEA